MGKKKVLKKFFSLDFGKLTPSRTFKSKLYYVSEEEFEKMITHMEDDNVTKYALKEKYDTIIIDNQIFKLDKKIKKEKI